VATVLAIMAASLIAVAGIWHHSRQAITKDVSQNLAMLAESIAANVDAELHESIWRPEQLDSPEYERAIAPLRAAHSRMGKVKFVYSAVRDGDKVRFVLDTSPDKVEDGVNQRAHVCEVYQTPDPSMLAALGTGDRAGVPASTHEPYTDKWGTFMSGYAPIITRDGRQVGVLGVDISAEEYRSSLAMADRAALLALLPCAVTAVGMGFIVYRVRCRQRDAFVALAHARARAEELSLAKSSFLANMSHEIRTPMTAIIGYAELLMDGGVGEKESKQHLRTIQRSGEHLLQIINDILDISKIESDKMQVERIACSPVHVLSDVEQLLLDRARAKGIALTFAWDGQVPRMIHTDPTRTRQILTNIVGNAIKFTAQGSVAVHARFTPSEHDGQLIIAVRDTGEGIAPEAIERLFKPFEQAEASTSRKYGGTGLGLSIAKRLAEALGGGITVISAPGQGSEFTITLATGPVPKDQLVSSHLAKELGEQEAQCTNELIALPARVLVAEDGPDNRRLLQMILTKSGAQLMTVENGRDAVSEAMAAHHRDAGYDLILMDMQMPELDGYGATMELRRRGYDGVIVALTAHTLSDDRERCLAAGCDDFLTKPVRRAELLRTCRKWYEARAEARKAVDAKAR
jgi:signal transduction histidine kinase/AmiR/NasT family two-component response regulator